MKNKYYQFHREGQEANIRIYGDIVDDAFYEGEVSALSFAQELDNLQDVEKINVYINSYGGSVSQGLAIHNMLKNHPAEVTTICDGFACSIASIIFLAGDCRIMNDGSILMIHEPWTTTMGNADELKRQVTSLEKLSQLSVDIYSSTTGVPSEKIIEMMKAETWLTPKECLEMGFATEIKVDNYASIAQSVKNAFMKFVTEGKEMKQPKEETVVEPIVINQINEEEVKMELNVNKNNNEMEREYDMLNRDNEIMKARGQRQLTNAEEKFYDKFIQSAKSRNPQQAFIELEGNEETAMPESIIEDVFKYMVEEHPLLAKVNAVYASYSTKWIVNNHAKQSAQWGEIDAEIQKEIKGAFRAIDLKQHKLSAFAQIPMGILDLGKTFLDAYIRKALAESVANALEQAIVNGDGSNCPVGLMKATTGAVDGVHQDKEAQAITEFSPAQINAVVAKIAQTEGGVMRNVNQVQLLVNNQDYLTKVLPAVQRLNLQGQYVQEMPFPTEIIICNQVPSGKAIMCKLDDYFLGVANGKDGQIEFSDEYRFLEDQRTFRVKMYATGMPLDNNVAQVLDISGLVEGTLKVKNA